jgi:hypothetical protein
MLLDACCSFGIGPIHLAHEHIHAATGTTGLVFATATIAEPGAGAVFVVKAIAIGPTAKRARLMLVG